MVLGNSCVRSRDAVMDPSMGVMLGILERVSPPGIYLPLELAEAGIGGRNVFGLQL